MSFNKKWISNSQIQTLYESKNIGAIYQLFCGADVFITEIGIATDIHNWIFNNEKKEFNKATENAISLICNNN